MNLFKKKLFRKLVLPSLCLLSVGCAQIEPTLGVDLPPTTAAPAPLNHEAEAYAQRSDSHAQYNLGMRYLLGVGGPQNAERAVYWFQKSADQHNAYAQDELGYLYAEGKIVPRDFGLALQWYQKAAKQNLASAQYNLGMMYQNGLGTAVDKTIAKHWFEKAAAQGFLPAKKMLTR